MIYSKDIVKAVNLTLKKHFPDVKVRTSDLDKNPKECFYTQATVSRGGSEDYVQHTGTVTVFFFPEDRDNNDVRLMCVQAEMEQAFYGDLFVTDSFALSAFDMEFELQEDALIMTFDWETWQTVDLDVDRPTMEELELAEIEI